MSLRIKSQNTLTVLRNQLRFSWNQKSHGNLHLNKLLSEMPRDRTHIAEAQKQRIRIKEKSVKYSPGTVNLQVLGSGAHGSPAAVYLFTDQSRYLFNCGEGTQRLAHEHKTKLARLEHIFVTRATWERLGGLPGLSLTVQDAGVPHLTLHGPQGLSEIFGAMRRFVILKDLKVNAVNCDRGGTYDDHIMTVFYVPINKEISTGISKNNVTEAALELDETDYYSYESNDEISTTPPAQLMNTNREKREESIVMCYICKLKPKPGSLNIEKCVDKGVPPGPLLGQLKNGFDITLSDGTVVRADEVRSATDPGPVIIFVDIPNESYLKSFEEQKKIFEPHQGVTNDEGNLALLVVHFSPTEIIEKESYKEFMEKFAPSTRHLILNSTNKFSGYLAAHRIQYQLNQLDENIFPILKEDFDIEPYTSITKQHKKLKMSTAEGEKKMDEKSNNNCLDPSNIHNSAIIDQANSLTCFHLRPRKGLDRDNEPFINPAEYLQETHAVEGFKDALTDLKIKVRKIHEMWPSENRTSDFPKIVFLGTGSCIPNKTRNVSAILLHTNENSCILLDCGEGTWGQIVRFYGFEQAAKVLEKLKVIYISHLHADHHIGLIGILKIRQQILGTEIPAIMLLAPIQISSWLHFYNLRIEAISEGYKLVPLSELVEHPLNTAQLSDMAIRSISTCLVKHCPHAFGVAFELNGTKNNKNEIIKISYSGDTMPSDNLIKLGMNSTVLIHEATMENELLSEAKFKRHSTISQAIKQGTKMNAKFILLTHFSQRYSKLPRIENNIGHNVGIAFDNMEVTLMDLQRLHIMYPTLKLMFSEHCEEMEQKALKRAFKNERKKLSARVSQESSQESMHRIL